MYYYFSSNYPAVIKINGMFYGKIQDVIKPLKIDKAVAPFIEICPLKPNGNAVNFILDCEFLDCPPDCVSVTDLKGGYLIKFYQRYDRLPFEIKSQEKFPDALVTVFTENSLKLSIETPFDFYAESFNLDSCTTEISAFNLKNQKFLAVKFSTNEPLLCIYHVGDKIKKVFSRNVSDFSFSPDFTTEEKFNDIAKHTVKSIWEFNDFNFNRKALSCKTKENFNCEELPERLVPYAFLENLLVGDEIDAFLDQTVKENADKLHSYFGEFIGIFPPPTFRDINEVGLIYPLNKNSYHVQYFTFELKDKKILNIKKCDN